MHFLTVFFAFLFTFGHAQSAQRSAVHDEFVPPAEYAGTIEYAVPSHQDILNRTYAVQGCPGCQMTNASYTTR